MIPCRWSEKYLEFVSMNLFYSGSVFYELLDVLDLGSC